MSYESSERRGYRSRCDLGDSTRTIGLSIAVLVSLAVGLRAGAREAIAGANPDVSATSAEAVGDSVLIEAAAPMTIPGLQFRSPLGASGWSKLVVGSLSSRDSFVAGSSVHPDSSSSPRSGALADGSLPGVVNAGTLIYRPSMARTYAYPAEGVRTSDGLYLSPELARLYGVRHVVLDRRQTALQGVGLAGSTALFAGAMASSFGLLDEKTALWAVGGAALLGAYYGATTGFEQPSWREQWRWPEERLSRDERP